MQEQNLANTNHELPLDNIVPADNNPVSAPATADNTAAVINSYATTPDNPATPLLLAQDLVKNYGNHPALHHINLTLPRGRIIGLLGPNGSGKTTFLKLACGLIQPTSGRLLINGNAPGIKTKAVTAYLPEKTYLNDWMRVKDIIVFFNDFYKDFQRERAMDMLQALKINENARLKTLSKGTQEKVQLILVMSRDADLYLLDEPIGGVDPAAREYIINTIINNYNDKASVLISSHIITDIEQVLDEVIFLNRGQLVMQETVDNLRDQHGKSVDAMFREVFKC